MKPSESSTKPQSARLQSLDSIRGCAALCVVFLHYVTMIDGSARFGLSTHKIIQVLRATPINLLWSGNQAVILFFILSGYVLTKMIRAAPSINPIKGFTFYLAYIIRRWIRLWPVYIVSILFALLVLNGHYKAQFDDLNPWINQFYQSSPTTKDFISHIFFIGNFDTKIFNFPIWSLVQEMRASIIFPFLLLSMDRFGMRKNLLIFSVISIFSMILYQIVKNSHYPDYKEIVAFFHYIFFFVIGICIYDSEAQISRWYCSLRKKQIIALSIIALIIYGYSAELPKIFHLRFGMTIHWIMLPSAVVIISFAIHSHRFALMLNNRIIKFLGKISYSLYVWHGILLIAWTLYFINLMSPFIFYLSLFIATVLTATLSERFIEGPSTRYSRYASKRIVKLFGSTA